MSETRALYTAKSFAIIDEQNSVHFAVTSEIDARAKALKMADEAGRMVVLLVKVDEFRPGQNVMQPGYEDDSMGNVDATGQPSYQALQDTIERLEAENIAVRKLIRAMLDGLPQCSCIPAYKERGLIAADCVRCNAIEDELYRELVRWNSEGSMQAPLEISEIERRMMEIDNQIKALEQLLRDLRNEYERQKIRLEVTRKRIAQSGIKY